MRTGHRPDIVIMDVMLRWTFPARTFSRHRQTSPPAATTERGCAAPDCSPTTPRWPASPSSCTRSWNAVTSSATARVCPRTEQHLRGQVHRPRRARPQGPRPAQGPHRVSGSLLLLIGIIAGPLRRLLRQNQPVGPAALGGGHHARAGPLRTRAAGGGSIRRSGPSVPSGPGYSHPGRRCTATVRRRFPVPGQ